MLYAGLGGVFLAIGVIAFFRALQDGPVSVVVPIYGVQKAVAAGIMPLWFLFALAYTRRRNGLSRPALSAIGGYYVVLVLLEVTNPIHGALRSSYTPGHE